MRSSHHNTLMVARPLVSNLCKVSIPTNQEILEGALSTPTEIVLRNIGLIAQPSQSSRSYIRELQELRVDPQVAF